MRSYRLLGAGLFALATSIVGYAVLGPLVLDVIHFRTSASGLDQIKGGDLAALAVVAPVCVVIGGLALRGHPAAPVLALAPALFALYTLSQLVLGNEYRILPGNVERFFPLLLGIFLLAAAVAVCARGLLRPDDLPVLARRSERGSGVLLLVIAAFVVLGLHLPTLLDAMGDDPTGRAYLDTPAAFWVVKFYDLGIVAPAALVIGVGLLRRRRWATAPAYVILGAYALLGWSVAAMAWSMILSGRPDASVATAIAMTGLAVALSVFIGFFCRPLFRAPADTPDLLSRLNRMVT
jgi:hypothetical protein